MYDRCIEFLKDLRRALLEAVALYRLVRQDPDQLESLLNSRDATVRQSGALKVAYVFKRSAAPTEFVLEPGADVARDPANGGGQFQHLKTDDVILACSVALVGSNVEEAGLGQLARPIGADSQPTVSSYFKPVEKVS